MALGEIRLFGGDYAPRDWKICDGSTLNIADYRPLYDKIGTKYGGDGRTTFLLPDLRGRAPMHRADGAALGTRGNITVEKARQKVDHARLMLNFIIDVIDAPYPNYEAFLGEVRAFGCNFAPEGWVHCEGQLLRIHQHTALFSVFNNTFGGDGRETFSLPDLREAYPVQPALPAGRAERGGAWTEHEGTSPQTPFLVVNYLVAVQGLYPGRGE
jgi:microcystin-dependent protein